MSALSRRLVGVSALAGAFLIPAFVVRAATSVVDEAPATVAAVTPAAAESAAMQEPSPMGLLVLALFFAVAVYAAWPRRDQTKETP